jgi:hypothetical protein
MFGMRRAVLMMMEGAADVDDELVRLREQLAFVHRARAVLLTCRAHPLEQLGSLAPLADRLADWHDHFDDLNTVTKDSYFSLTDMAFVAQSLTLYCESADVRAGVTIHSIAQAYVELVVIGCQHTLDAREYWPSPADWNKLKLRIAGVVAVFFDSGPRTRAELIARINSESFAFEDMPEALRFPFLTRKTPPSLLADKEKKRKALEDALQAGKRVSREDRDEVSEEGAGLMWRNTGEELVNNFVRMAARTIHVVERHNGLWTMFTHKPAPRFTRQTIARAERWVVAKCQVEQTEELTMLFRNTANEWFWPLGAATHRFRNAYTRANKADALTVLADELGVDLSQHLHDRSLGRLDALSKETGGLYWNALFTALFVYTMRQRVRMDWLAHYFFSDLSPQAETRIHAEHYMGDDKRPIVLQLCRRWLVFHNKTYLDCGCSLLHAVLTWLYIVQTEFGGQLENTEDIREVCAVFLEDGHVVV